MRILGKAKNRWGWLRLAGILGMAVVVVWALTAALLRGLGDLPGLAWSGYADFTLAKALEWLMVPLAAVLVGGWLEDHEHASTIELDSQRENERRLAAQREEALRQLHAAVDGALAAAKHGEHELPSPARAQLAEAVQTALAQLDGKGRGEVLSLLHGKKLVETPFAELAQADFSGALLHNARLNGTHLPGANFAGAKIDGSHLSKCDFTGANLARVFIQHSDLRGSVLAGCDLSRSRLIDVDLEGADLSAAVLEDAFFKNANLKHARVPETFDQATLIETVLPDGRRVTNQNGKEYLKQKEYADLVDKL